MKLFIFYTLLAIAMVTQSTQASKTKVLNRSRRSVLMKTMHKIWLNRHKRDVDITKLVALRKKLTRMRRELLTGPPQIVKVEIKFKSDWLHHMSKHDSTQYRLMDGNIQDAIFTELFGDTEFIESKVLTLKESQDKKVLADIEFDFDQNEEDPLRHLRAVVETGWISGMEVYKYYFVILNNNPAGKPEVSPNKALDASAVKPSSQPTAPPHPPTPPAGPHYQDFQFDIKLKQPWDQRLSDQNDNMTKTLEDHIRHLIKIIFDKEPNFLDVKVESISNGPDAHPFVRIMLRFKPGENNPADKMLQLVKSGLLGDIPIFTDYLNGQIPGTGPPPKKQEPSSNNSSVQYNPPPQASPEAPAQTSPQPPAPPPTPAVPVPTEAFVQTTVAPPQPKKLTGSFILDQTWYPFMDNIQSATDKILSDDIAKAIKDAYASYDIGVKILGLGRSPDGKIQVNYELTFPSELTPSLKPLQDAMADGFLGGFPIYTGKKADNPAPTAAPTSPNWYKNQTGQASTATQTGYTAQTGYTPPAGPTISLTTQFNQTSYTGQSGYTPPADQSNPPINQTSYPGYTALPSQAEQSSITPPEIPPLSSNNQPSYTGQTTYTTPINQTSYTNQYSSQASPTAAPSQAPLNEVPILPANPPVVKYQPGVVPLPRGIPHSCEEIRSYGIGNEDGEYVIKARDKCHLSIICQNMKEPHPKEYLGGPAQKEWMYYHYAVLVRISAQDKKTIDKRACLENTATGREFIAKVMAADAAQGNPLVPWKTNIKRMIHSYIGDKRKKKRSMENMDDITLCTKAIKILKRHVN